MNSKKRPLTQSVEPQWMTRVEVAALFRVSARTVDAMVAGGLLKAHNLGPRLVRFHRSDVEAALTPRGGA